MKGTKRTSVGVRKELKRKNKNKNRTSIVTYLKSDAYLFAPLFSNFPPLTTEIDTSPLISSESSKVDDISSSGFEALGIEWVIKKKNRRMAEKVKQYLKSDSHMYAPMIMPPKLDSSLKGKLQITNLVTMEVSTSTTSIKENNNSYLNVRSDITEQTLHNKERINSPKRGLSILEGQRTKLSRETDLSPAFSSLQEGKMVKLDQRKVTFE